MAKGMECIIPLWTESLDNIFGNMYLIVIKINNDNIIDSKIDMVFREKKNVSMDIEEAKIEKKIFMGLELGESISGDILATIHINKQKIPSIGLSIDNDTALVELIVPLSMPTL